MRKYDFWLDVFRNVLNDNGHAMIKVSGNSMYPVINDGDYVTIIPQQDYKRGDIIVFQYNDEGLLVHRMICSKNQFYYCKGDNAIRIEELTYGKICGKVVKVNNNEVGFSEKVKSVIEEISSLIYECDYVLNEVYLNEKYKILYERIKNAGGVGEVRL